MSLVFKLPLPPSLNHFKAIGRGGKPYTTPAYHRWKDTAGWMAILQMKDQKGHLLVGDLRATIVFERKGDLDNRIKPLLDLLQDIRAFRNDRQVAEIAASFGDIVGCEVKLEEMGGADAGIKP